MSNLNLTKAQLTVVSEFIAEKAGNVSSTLMSRSALKAGLDIACTAYTAETGIQADKIPLAKIPLIFGMVCGVELYIEPETFAERVWAYSSDLTVFKADGTVDMFPPIRLVAFALNATEHDVRLIMGGAAGVQADQAEMKSVRKVYRRTREQKRSKKIVYLQWCTASMCLLLKDFGLSPETIADIVQVYQRPEAKWMIRGIVYNWQGMYDGTEFKVYSMRIPKAAVRALIGALVQIMPQPVQEIRQKLVHGSDEEPVQKTKVNEYYPNFLFTEEMNTILRLAVFIVQPYTDQKISNEERIMTGQVYERSLYRQTDMGQQGRRFSLDDRTDILDRTVIMSFCPLICRSVPVTDKGNGLVIMPECTTETWIGEHTYTYMQSAKRLTAKADRLRLCRDRGYKMKQGKRIPFTEQMYNDEMSLLPQFPKKDRLYKEVVQTVPSYFIRFTCTQTGQQFTVPTTSVKRAGELAKMTGVVAELDTPIVYTSVQGPFGNGDIVQNDTYLIPDGVREYKPEGVFFRSLKFVTRSLFQYLFRRAMDTQPLASEDGDVRRARKNSFAPFSLYNLLERLEEFAGTEDTIQLSTEELDMIETELMLPEHLPRTSRGNARTAEYCNRRFMRTGHECQLDRKQYRQLKIQLYASILAKIERANEMYTVQPPTEMERGPGLFDCPVASGVRIQIPPFSSMTVVQNATKRGTALMNTTFPAKVMVRRTWEECRELDNNPRVRKYTDHKQVVMNYEMWTDEQGNYYVPEGTHDDVCI